MQTRTTVTDERSLSYGGSANPTLRPFQAIQGDRGSTLCRTTLGHRGVASPVDDLGVSLDEGNPVVHPDQYDPIRGPHVHSGSSTGGTHLLTGAVQHRHRAVGGHADLPVRAVVIHLAAVVDHEQHVVIAGVVLGFGALTTSVRDTTGPCRFVATLLVRPEKGRLTTDQEEGERYGPARGSQQPNSHLLPHDIPGNRRHTSFATPRVCHAQVTALSLRCRNVPLPRRMRACGSSIATAPGRVTRGPETTESMGVTAFRRRPYRATLF